ncbi:MAG: substrate-binding domain-containing protein [Desulfuromonadaceae bacterium]|nr:substrate-binding domain-containing protein [Desulfuromonadaceae bacterium]
MTLDCRSWKILLYLLIIVTLLAGGAFPATAQTETIIKIGGTGSALGTMKQLASAYEKSHPGVSIRILPSLGSTAGIKAVSGGGLDLGLASRPLTESERQLGVVAVEFARSPFVFITNRKVNKKNVSLRELESFYSNPEAKWPDGSRIRLVMRPEKDIDTKLLRNLSPGMESAVKAAQVRSGMIRAITDQESTDALVRTPGALGCATLGEIISENRPVNILSFNGVKPGIKTAADGSYPLVKSIYLLTTAKTPAAARQFAEFVRSPAAGTILTKNGNLAVNVQ